MSQLFGCEFRFAPSITAPSPPRWLSATLAIALVLLAGSAARAQSTGQTPAGSNDQTVKAPGASAPDTARQLAALKKACAIGALSKDECAQRMASLSAQPAPRIAPQPAQMSSNDPNWNPNAPAPAVSKAYRDDQGWYSLTVPDGWTAMPAADGSGTLKLGRGPAWATVELMSGSRPKDITLGILDDMEPRYHNTAMVDQNGFQYNGHTAYGAHASGVDSSGTQVIVTVISIKVSGQNFLRIVSSAPTDQAQAINDQIMQMLHSVRFAGE